MEIARGIHPAILAQGGLGAALHSLARRSAVPVDVDAQIEGLLPDEVEVAAYYVASEALADVRRARARFCRARRCDDGRRDPQRSRFGDDGVGGAALGEGSGPRWLCETEFEALGGHDRDRQLGGNGTCVAVTLPIAAEPDQEIEKFLGPRQELGSHTQSGLSESQGRRLSVLEIRTESRTASWLRPRSSS